MKTSMACDQHGQFYHNLGPHPRSALMERLGRKRAQRMFVDGKDGKSYQTGWIIAGLWLSVYHVEPLRKAA